MLAGSAVWALTIVLALAEDDALERRFKRFDQNNDGFVTPDELKNEGVFKQLDRNNDGKITREEAARFAPKADQPKPTAPTTEAKPAESLKPLAEPARDLDPVVFIGQVVSQLLGKAPDKIVAFRWQDGWQQIPMQIDQRYNADLGRNLGGAGQTVFKTLVYADAKLKTGADPDPLFDTDDEVALMFRDTGNRATSTDPPDVASGSRVELRLVDEQAKAERFVYLFVSAGELRPDAGKDYVKYTFKLVSGNPFGNGPNPEDSVIETARYRNHFSDRWVHDGATITVGGANGVDILDRDEAQFAPGVCGRSTDTFSRGAGAFIANMDGPIRAIRSVFGCNSGKFTQRDYYCYEGQMTVRTFIRVHPIGSTWAFYDFSPEASGMTYYDNLNPQGVTVDGQPDDVKTGPMTWQYLTGKQGSLSIAFTADTDIPSLVRSSFYFDDTGAGWKACTGDAVAYAASGPATGPLPNTDPVLPRATTVNRLITDRIVYYDAPNQPVTHAHARVTAAWFPVRVENTAMVKGE
jgi:hypothetical protein